MVIKGPSQRPQVPRAQPAILTTKQTQTTKGLQVLDRRLKHRGVGGKSTYPQ